ncbi:MAG: formylglycine-generating enzyme family protein [Methylococcales bacterium]|nr:formylglycine-generating enzyme family protein [Methylococcales bacterium]
MPTPHNPPPDFPAPWASAWGEDAIGFWMAFTYKGVQQMFRWIESGTFTMGSPLDEAERFSIETPHTVTLSVGYWLADTTVTLALWVAVMEANPSHFQCDEKPVDTVSWHDAQAFIAKLNGLNPELALYLPSEAQWEYACRAGTVTPFAFGDQIDASLVNFDGNYPYNNGKKSAYREQTVAVKSLPPNAWGLYEMHGNVWEWCQDVYGAYPGGAVTDPLGPAIGDFRVLRGGSWIRYGRLCRSAFRRNSSPNLAGYGRGFRLARGHQAASPAS